MTELHKVYGGAPSTTTEAYKKAQEGLQRNQDMTFTDEEIDAFLPEELKRIAPAQAVLNKEVERIVPKQR